MPPTIPSAFGHPKRHSSSRSVDNNVGHSPESTQYPQTRKLAGLLLSRNISTIEGEGQAMPPEPSPQTFSPYAPSLDLHPSIVTSSIEPGPSISPDPGTSTSSSSSHHNINIFAITIAFSAIFICVLCILFAWVLAHWLKGNKSWSEFFQGIFCFHRRSKSGRATPSPEREPTVLIGVDFVPHGSPLIHDTTIDMDLEKTSTHSGTIVEPPNGPPRIPAPSIASAESLTIRPDYSTPTMTGFHQRLAAEEADISMAIGIAMRDCTFSGSELSSMTQSHPQIPVIDEQRDTWSARNRARQGSDASDSTKPTAESDVFSIVATTQSSLSSIVEIVPESDVDELDIEEIMDLEREEDMIFEVARAHSQSMEIKRGVLVDWNLHRASLSPVPEEEPELITVRLDPASPSASFTTVPSLVVTCPSMMTIPVIRPSFSSVSVDLNEFPLPPSAFHYDKEFNDEFEMCMKNVNPYDIGVETYSMYM